MSTKRSTFSAEDTHTHTHIHNDILFFCAFSCKHTHTYIHTRHTESILFLIIIFLFSFFFLSHTAAWCTMLFTWLLFAASLALALRGYSRLWDFVVSVAIVHFIVGCIGEF